MADSGSPRGVLVTGAAGGIGTATVRALSERGYWVFAAVHTDSGASRDLAKLPGVAVLPMDVADPDSVAAAANRISVETGGEGLRAVVNNAGVIVQGPLELIPVGELRRQFEVNTYGPVYVTQAFLPLLRAGHGRVVNVTAPSARVPIPFMASLSASKAALDALSSALRLELAAWRMPVVLVEPGSTETPIFGKAAVAAQRALDTLSPHQLSLYRDHLAAVGEAQAKMRLRPAAPVAAAIVSAVSARSPRRRYVVGDARAVGLVARLPARLRERMIIGMLGLRGLTAR
ncbi:SDR family NAD(P)-dependent oxidoreductase [Parafrankia sp. EUN1f]|uniref:SDR family NAD(P)-dependent oxidoreductase n=1 Tax=Parafrankia sp. EUN1f TaxID=102897 RepID=UPI0001C46BB4|nr:SDR family NAD(P)-dependent oxidoreductase [Parafrankia sp. EUN1f]EFC82177.1 short-chain dehydrogenase/reductase SDR [Parafrankia sp. EUN1f]